MGHDDNHNYENDEMCRKWMNMYLFMYVIMYLMIYLYISTYIKCFNLGNLALHTILALHLINKLMIKWIYKNNTCTQDVCSNMKKNVISAVSENLNKL